MRRNVYSCLGPATLSYLTLTQLLNYLLLLPNVYSSVVDAGTTEKKAAKSLHSSASSSVLTPRIITVEKTIREPVDENNSIVLDLVNAGFPVDMSVDAVAKYETLEAALEHLEMMEEEGDEEEERLIPVKTQLSREDSRGADVQMDW